MDLEPKLKIYNTLTKQKEEFTPISNRKVGLYLCGPTVYDYPTIGNFRTYIFGDIIHRVLKYNGYQVNYVQNITDVGHLVSDNDEGEDKMEKGARKSGKDAWETARFFEDLYWKDSDKLNILRPTISCRATDHIEEQIDMIKDLECGGFTYKTNDGIYFDTSKLADYGKLAHLNIEGLKEGARVEINPEKKNITDFALWKFSLKNVIRQMEWDPKKYGASWNIGFPGWHIECSAMSIKYLGEPFDIHAGAIDLIPVHHTNEIAQNEALYGHKTVNYWLHGGFLSVDGKKMGKSLGNTYQLSDMIAYNLAIIDVVEEEFNPLVFRYLTFTAHYRQSLNFTWESFHQAGEALSRLYKTGARLLLDNSLDLGKIDKKRETEFLKAVNDDLNMPQAIAIVWETLRDGGLDTQSRLATLYRFDEVLGLDLKKYFKNFYNLLADSQGDQNFPENIIELNAERNRARKNKEWEKSDELRLELEKLGYKVEDRGEESLLRKI